MDLDPRALERLVAGFLAEDVGHGDLTTEAVIPADALGRARIEAREAAVIAGLPVARACFDAIGGIRLEWDSKVDDGSSVGPGEVLATIEGPLRTILTAERTALNLLGRL